MAQEQQVETLLSQTFNSSLNQLNFLQLSANTANDNHFANALRKQQICSVH